MPDNHPGGKVVSASVETMISPPSGLGAALPRLADPAFGFDHHCGARRSGDHRGVVGAVVVHNDDLERVAYVHDFCLFFSEALAPILNRIIPQGLVYGNNVIVD